MCRQCSWSTTYIHISARHVPEIDIGISSLEYDVGGATTFKNALYQLEKTPSVSFKQLVNTVDVLSRLVKVFTCVLRTYYTYTAV